jgi:hypothetical protein
MPLPLLRPLRDYDEKNVINLFSFSGQTSTSQIINRGTLVGIVSDWRNDNDPLQILGSYGDFSVNNVQALRYGTVAQVGYASAGTTSPDGIPASSGAVTPLGLTLFDVRELDENTIPLKYNPRKAAELEACISGQAVPIVTRGLFLYSGLTGAFGGGAALFSNGISGGLTAFPTVYSISGATGGAGFTGSQPVFQAVTNFQVGHALGGTGVDGCAFIKLEL